MNAGPHRDGTRLIATSNPRRRAVAMAAVGVALCIGGLSSLAQPQRAGATNTLAATCAPLWSDATADASAGVPASQQDQLDIVSGSMTDNNTSLTTVLTMKNLSTTVATGATANEYYMVWGFNGVQYYTNAEVSTTGTTYAYGTYSSTTGFSATGTATGQFTAGANGTIAVTVPFSAIGNPVDGDAFAKASIFGQTGTLTGAGGSGLVSTTDKDAATSDYTLGGCAGATPTATPTSSPSGTPTSSAGTACAVGNPEQNISENGWICPVKISGLPLGEPTLIHDSGTGNTGVQRLFAIAPQAIGNVNSSGGSPLFTSVDGGLTWTGPVSSQFCTGTGGGDTDLTVDSADNIYSTDLWLGNSCMSVSEDHGQSVAAGSPYGQELQPGDDRPWLAYSSSANEVFGVYDGETGLRATSTAPLVNPAAGVQAIQDTIVIPESAVSSSSVPSSTRQCVCPPGGIAVDNSSGGAHSHAGRVYVTYSDQLGEAISYADPTCSGISPPVCTITPQSWNNFGVAPTVVPNSIGSGSAFENEYNFSPVKVDANGTVYAMWARAVGFDGSTRVAGASGVQMYYAYSTDGGTSWSQPILVSTEDGPTGALGTTTFPSMDVVGNGVLDMSWYGTTATGDPNTVPAGAQWNVYYTRVSNADGSKTGGPSIDPPSVAILDMHNGCIQSGGGKACADRSLLDFFTLVDGVSNAPGSTAVGPELVYDAGDVNGGVNVWFTKLTPQAGTVIPEAPRAGILLVPGILAILGSVLIARRRRGVAMP